MSQEEELDIKNLRTMADVWLVLNREYGASEDLVNESVNSLKHFAFSNSAKTVPEKFRELYLCYKQVRSDLVEVDQLEVLNHEPTLWSVIKKFPSQDSKNRFVEYREYLQGEPHTPSGARWISGAGKEQTERLGKPAEVRQWVRA